MIWVREDLAPLFAGLTFGDFLALGQDTVRVGGDGTRRTSRFHRGGREFYVKVHGGAGWRELLENWLQLKPAVVDALPEARALERCASAGIRAPRLAAFGCEGRNPARRRSFVVTESLSDTEDLAVVLRRELVPGDGFALRRELARALGELTARLHAVPLVHRDLYLTHFRVGTAASAALELYLIDLHRAHAPSGSFERWRRKDLAALRYSTLELPITRADCARFLRTYLASASPSRSHAAERAWRRRIERRGRAIQARLRRRPSGAR